MLLVVGRPSLRAKLVRMQSVRQAATEVPVLQIWTDQSPQLCPTRILGTRKNEPLPVCTQGSNRPTGLPQTVQPSMARRCWLSQLFPLRSLRVPRMGMPQVLQDLGGAAKGVSGSGHRHRWAPDIIIAGGPISGDVGRLSKKAASLAGDSSPRTRTTWPRPWPASPWSPWGSPIPRTQSSRGL